MGKKGLIKNIAQYIDHTLLKPTAKFKDIEHLCHEANQMQFAAICVHPYYVAASKQMLTNHQVKVCTVVGFPLGCNMAAIKAEEAKTAVKQGASEIDMVMNMAAFKCGQLKYVEDDIRSVVKAVPKGIVVKVILETCNLSVEQIKSCSRLSMQAGAQYVKTSTGFGSGGATVEAVLAMKQAVGDKMGIKASGGIRTYKECLKMIQAGATRIGTSSGVEIMKELERLLSDQPQ